MEKALLAQLSRCTTLPTLPAVAVQVLDLCQKADPEIPQIAKVISNDAALAAKLLKMVNSPLFGLRNEVTTVSHAISMLGLNSVRTMALSFTLAQSMKGGKQAWFNDFWKRSALAASAAREIANIIGMREREEAFLGGLLQDIGMLAFAQIARKEYDELANAHEGHHDGLAEAEQTTYGCDHSRVGGWLVEKWKLPLAFKLVVEHSHRPAALPEDTKPDVARLVHVVAAAGRVADLFLTDDMQQAMGPARSYTKDLLGMEAPEFEALLSGLKKHVPEVGAFFDVSFGSPEEIDGLLEEARETLVLLSAAADLQMQEALGTAQARAVAAETQAQRDPMTGLANRASFDAFLKEQMAIAKLHKKSLSIVMVDVDHFKSVNDTYGHLAGDEVLKAVAELLKNGVRPRDLAARYGGEEFVLVLPETPAEGCRVVAERTRAKIAATDMQTPSGEVMRVTASLGCASYDATVYPSPALFIQAADEALYEAKRSGRNKVCLAGDLHTGRLEAALAQAAAK
ncbi:MAG: GGDEF domain-containing protein [Myxococcales bacterium]|nr:GGDEF domain-containing protein [Myxococcales bacterium]